MDPEIYSVTPLGKRYTKFIVSIVVPWMKYPKYNINLQLTP